MRSITQVCLQNKSIHIQTCLYQMMTNCCHFSNFNKSEMLRLNCTSIHKKIQALLMQESNPFLTKPTQWRILLLKVVFLWIVLTHINDGISSSILVNLFTQLLLMPWMRGWMQCPTLVNEMTTLLTMSANLLHFLFLLPLLGKLPENGLSLPTLWNTMVI